MPRARGAAREQRRHKSPRADDFRSPFQRDRDRVLHAAELRRLVGITQVVGPNEGPVFHNRLTHTIEVAQIGRRIAERWMIEDPRLQEKGYLDADVVEAAALVHDLGHPPFGHVGERTLDRLSRDALPAGVAFDGFEGNAQSFRIICRTAVHDRDYDGLNLTRATLAATLKYPWLREASGKRSEKFGAYRTELADYRFAATGAEEPAKTLEAEIMDYADDVAYSINDLLDFYQAGLLPFDRLFWDRRLLNKFVSDWVDGIEDAEYRQRINTAHGQQQFLNTLSLLIGDAPFDGTKLQRAHLRTVASKFIGEYVMAFSVKLPSRGGPIVQIEQTKRIEIAFLKRLVWHFVIASPRLATQQTGQEEALRALFRTYLAAVRNRRLALIPRRLAHELEALPKPEKQPTAQEVRLAVDIVAALTDRQALAMFRRMAGFEPGSVMDLIE